jgi:hypothetical protein
MNEYRVDRARLESMSTEEILTILREEQDDYTPEAIQVFQEILDSRGYVPEGLSEVPTGAGLGCQALSPEAIANPNDAVRVLNGLLTGVLDGSVDPQVAQVASNVVMGILHALDQKYMTEMREDS